MNEERNEDFFFNFENTYVLVIRISMGINHGILERLKPDIIIFIIFYTK